MARTRSATTAGTIARNDTREVGRIMRSGRIAATVTVRMAVAAAMFVAADATAATTTIEPPRVVSSPAELRLASLDGLDADAVYARMGLDLRRHIVRLRVTKRSGGSGICMGVTIAKRYVLTAGHCLRDAATVEASRRPSVTGADEVTPVATWLVHPTMATSPAGASQLPEPRRAVAVRHVHRRRDLGLVLLAAEFPGGDAPLALPEEHVLRDWTGSAAVIGFDRDRDTRALTDRLSFIPLNHVRRLEGSAGAVAVGEVGMVFDREIKDVPRPSRLAYCQGDSGAPVLSHFRTAPAAGRGGRYDVRLIGISGLGAVPLPRFGRGRPAPVGCYREVIWFSLTDPTVRRWLVEAELLLRRRHCLEASRDPWCTR